MSRSLNRTHQRSLLRLLHYAGIPLTVAVLTRAISACGAAEEPHKALGLLREMQTRVRAACLCAFLCACRVVGRCCGRCRSGCVLPFCLFLVLVGLSVLVLGVFAGG